MKSNDKIFSVVRKLRTGVWIVGHSNSGGQDKAKEYLRGTTLNVALPARGKAYWDGTTTHNPTIIKKDSTYYLYYMGTTSPIEAKHPTSMKNKDWWVYRNNQRIGVAWSKNSADPWQRLDKRGIDVSAAPTAPDALITSNSAINIAPDGRIFAVYKCVGKQAGWKPLQTIQRGHLKSTKSPSSN